RDNRDKYNDDNNYRRSQDTLFHDKDKEPEWLEEDSSLPFDLFGATLDREADKARMERMGIEFRTEEELSRIREQKRLEDMKDFGIYSMGLGEGEELGGLDDDNDLTFGDDVTFGAPDGENAPSRSRFAF